MPVYSGSAQTRFGLSGWGVRPAGSFSGKTEVVSITLIDPHTASIGPLPLSLAANAVVRLRVKRRAGSDTHYTMPEGSSLTIRGEL